MKRHFLLPDLLTPEACAAWLKSNYKEKFDNETKIIYTNDDISEFSVQSSRIGGEQIGLSELSKIVADHIKNGGEEQMITLPQTRGTKSLGEDRHILDMRVKKGYETKTETIYGIPDYENEMMVYFNETGEHISDRDRKFSARESVEFGGLFKRIEKASNE